MKDLRECRVKDLDDIYYATKDSQGINNAMYAIKYVLFNDKSVFNGRKPEENKYLYISNTNNARKKAMLLQQDDLAHILIKYCMASFGLRRKDFTLTDEELLLNQKRVERLEISPYEMIEQVAFAAVNDTYVAYQYLFANHQLLIEVVDYMLNERYTTGLKDALDSFSGIIDNNDVSSDVRYSFYDAYQSLDDNFEEIKRNNPEYIK